MERKTYIYSLSCPITGKVRYIGKSNNPKNRLSEHKRMRDKNFIKNEWIMSLISKNLNPVLTILEEVSILEWKDREKYYIDLYSYDLLNICGGGNGTNFGNQTSFRNGQGNKKVIALNENGTINQKFNSLKEAIYKYGTSINSVLSGSTKKAYGYIWMYVDEYEKMTIDEVKTIVDRANNNMSKVSWKKGIVKYQFKTGRESDRKKIVYQYTLDNVLVKEWSSVSEAEKETGARKISMCANGIRKKSMGFKWSYKLLK